jgi:Ca2+-transporting ATPase
LTFATLILGIVALILVDRSRSASIFTAILRPNRALAIVLPIVTAMLAMVLLWKPALDLFGFAPLEPGFLAVPVGAGLGVLMALEAVKPIWRGALDWSARRRGMAAHKAAAAKTTLR